MVEQADLRLILVHGAWHGAWCWAELESRLGERGVAVQSVELTSQGHDAQSVGNLYSDAEVVRGAASSFDGPVVLLGHSYGGLVISRAAQQLGNVVQLIYLSAFLSEKGESLLSIVQPWAASGADLSWLETSPDGLLTVAEGRAREVMYHDCDAETAGAAVSQLRPQSGVSFQQPVGEAVSPARSLYIVCTQDRAIPPAGQQQMAREADRVVELSAGHCPFLSQPDLLSDLLTGHLQRLGSPDVAVRASR